MIIENALAQIHEPLGVLTQWLSNLVSLFHAENCRQALLDYFLPVIELRLHAINRSDLKHPDFSL